MPLQSMFAIRKEKKITRGTYFFPFQVDKTNNPSRYARVAIKLKKKKKQQMVYDG